MIRRSSLPRSSVVRTDSPAVVARFVATRVSCPLRGPLPLAFLQFLIVSSALHALRALSSLHFVLDVSHWLWPFVFVSGRSFRLLSLLSCGCARRGCLSFPRGRFGPMPLLAVPSRFWAGHVHVVRPAVAFRPEVPSPTDRVPGFTTTSVPPRCVLSGEPLCVVALYGPAM